jgi:hypothetical protein
MKCGMKATIRTMTRGELIDDLTKIKIAAVMASICGILLGGWMLVRVI